MAWLAAFEENICGAVSGLGVHSLPQLIAPNSCKPFQMAQFNHYWIIQNGLIVL